CHGHLTVPTVAMGGDASPTGTGGGVSSPGEYGGALWLYGFPHSRVACGRTLSDSRFKLSRLPDAVYAASSQRPEPAPCPAWTKIPAGAAPAARANSPPYFSAPGSIISSPTFSTRSKRNSFTSAAVRRTVPPHRPRASNTHGPALSAPTRS